MPYYYATNCVNSTARLIHAMQDAAREITYRTARKHLPLLDDWAAGMGYDTGNERGGLRLVNDWHVGYYKSVYNGCPCIYIQHSAIEFIFLKEKP